MPQQNPKCDQCSNRTRHGDDGCSNLGAGVVPFVFVGRTQIEYGLVDIVIDLRD